MPEPGDAPAAPGDGHAAAGAGDAACAHADRDDRAVCVACGHCLHDIVLNGACLHCGATDIDPVAMSPKPLPTPMPLIPLDRLRKKPG